MSRGDNYPDTGGFSGQVSKVEEAPEEDTDEEATNKPSPKKS
jgi:hypothetical protein